MNSLKNKSQLEEALKEIDLFVLWEKIYHFEKLGRYYFSPLRDDGKNPAFDIRDDGQVRIDHGTGEGFNVITLIARVEGLSRSEALPAAGVLRGQSRHRLQCCER